MMGHSSWVLVSIILLATPVYSSSIPYEGRLRLSRDTEVFPRKDRTDLAKSISRANTEFAIDLLKSLSAKKENVAFSPFGINSAFGIVSLSAKGKTLDEIQKSLHYSEIKSNSTDDVNSILKDFIRNMKNSKGKDGDFASGIFTHSDCGISPIFGRQAIDIFQSDIQQLNFNFKKSAVDTINRWVSKETKNKITGILSEESLDPETRLMLLNAVYFKGTWENPFNVNSTQDQNFTLLDNSKVPVKMMRKTAEFRYGFDSDTDSKVVILPYKDSKLSMAILLPRKNDGLPQFIEKLSPDTVKRMISNSTLSLLTLGLPRFKLETEYSLKNIMSGLGIHDLFDKQASISGIFCNQTLYVNQMLHKTFVEVDEAGTTASSLTAMDLRPLLKPVEFNVDHPFVFVIYDQESEVVLFIGAVYNFP